MNTQQLIQTIRDNGGLDVNHLRQSKKLDNSKMSIKAYVCRYIMNYYDVSRYIAEKVYYYYL